MNLRLRSKTAGTALEIRTGDFKMLQDARGVLVQQTENVQAARQIRFTHVWEIAKLEPVLKAYAREAIEVEKAGLEVTYGSLQKCLQHLSGKSNW